MPDDGEQHASLPGGEGGLAKSGSGGASTWRDQLRKAVADRAHAAGQACNTLIAAARRISLSHAGAAAARIAALRSRVMVWSASLMAWGSKVGWTRLLVGGIAMAVVIPGLAVVLYEFSKAQSTSQPSLSRMPEIIPARSDPPPEPAPPPPKVISSLDDVRETSPFLPHPLGHAGGRLRRTVLFEPPYETLDAIRFRARKQVVLISGVSAPPWDAVCRNEEGALWGCGRRAQVALHNLIRAEPLVCTLDAMPGSTRELEYLAGDCRGAFGDLATAIVRGGWARPESGLATPDLRRAMDHAELEKLGLWQGNWTLHR